MISADWFAAAPPLQAAPSVPAGCFAVWFHLTVASASHHHTHYFLLLPLRLCTRVNPALVSLLSALLRSLPAVLSLASLWGDTRPTLIILSVTKVVTETMIMMRAHILSISISIKCGCICSVIMSCWSQLKIKKTKRCSAVQKWLPAPAEECSRVAVICLINPAAHETRDDEHLKMT